MGLSGATVVGKGLEVELVRGDLRKASARAVCCKVDTRGIDGARTITVGPPVLLATMEFLMLKMTT